MSILISTFLSNAGHIPIMEKIKKYLIVEGTYSQSLVHVKALTEFFKIKQGSSGNKILYSIANKSYKI